MVITYSANQLRIRKVKVYFHFDSISTNEIEATRDRRLIGVAEEQMQKDKL